MKKILSLIILICFLNIYSSAVFSAEKTVLKAEKINSKYALVDKTANREILPAIYDKIRKVKYDKKLIVIAEAADYITLYSPDGLYNDFLKKYYKSNKYNSSVRFLNYPDNAVIVYKQNKKYGLIAVENGILKITKPVYAKISYPDENSIVSKFLNISFSPYDSIIAYTTYAKGQYNFLTLQDIFEGKIGKYSKNAPVYTKTRVYEEIQTQNGLMDVSYKNIQPAEKKIIIPEKTEIKLNNRIYNPEQIYLIINNNTPYQTENYPINAAIKSGYHLYIYNNGAENEIVKPCSDFYIQNSLLKELTGFDISFEYKNIIAKHSEWGILNEKSEIKVPFQYDLIIPIGSEIYENIGNNNGRIILEYQGQVNTGLFLVKKGYGWAVINENNEIIVPFEYKRSMENSELAEIKSKINRKIQDDYSREQREETKRNLPYVILDMLLLPIWILLPYPLSFHADINYFD